MGSYGEVVINENNVLKTTDIFNKKNNLYTPNLQEVVFLSIIKHNNIIKLNKIEINNNKFILDLEKGDKTLHKFIEKTPKIKRIEYFEHILWQLIEVLYFMHKNNFIHGDLKPNNIIINNDYQIKLIDFGGICSFRINKEHKPLSTHSFCPPEGYRDIKKYINKKYDIWALGSTMYFYLTKEYIINSDDEKTLEYTQKFTSDMKKLKYPDIKNIKSLINDKMYKLMKKMLSYNIEDRLSSKEIYLNQDNYFDNPKKNKINTFKISDTFDYTFMFGYNNKNWETRKKSINFLYNICIQEEIFYNFVLSVWILDKYICITKKIIGIKKYKLYSLCCLILASHLINIKPLKLNLQPKYNYIDIIMGIIDILQSLDYKIYTPTFDYMIEKNNYNKLRGDIILELLTNEKYVGKFEQKRMKELYINLLNKN
jgi:serine/threonine protein kinase